MKTNGTFSNWFQLETTCYVWNWMFKWENETWCRTIYQYSIFPDKPTETKICVFIFIVIGCRLLPLSIHFARSITFRENSIGISLSVFYPKFRFATDLKMFLGLLPKKKQSAIAMCQDTWEYFDFTFIFISLFNK